MAAFALESIATQTDVAKRVSGDRDQKGALARLAILHAEAEETARLSNLLGRSLYAAIALPLIGALAIGLADSVDLSRQLVWCGFVVAVSVAILRIYLQTIGKPFDREALKAFAKNLSPILLFAGFVWGAGAFLALPKEVGIGAAILFTATPAIVVAALLREREAVFLFLAPVAALTAFASVLQPFADGALDAAAILIACAAIAGVVAFFDRRRVGEFERPAMLSLT